MKPIIVGTDFSQGSFVALEIAVDIANKMRSDIKLIWVRKEKKLVSLDEASRKATEQLKALCAQHNPNMKYGRVEWEILGGKVENAIADAVRHYDGQMVVIGTNGASGYEKYIMGSTAVRIVQEAPCPVLTIREGFNFHKASTPTRDKKCRPLPKWPKSSAPRCTSSVLSRRHKTLSP